MEGGMMATEAAPHMARLTGVAPQFLVDDLRAAIGYYRDKLGFGVDFCYDSFYAGVSRDGIAIHLKCAPKTLSDRTHRKQNEHLDAYISVTGVAMLHDELRARGALITKSLETRPWSCIDFYVEDPDGYILCFSEPTA
jgi:catechol 2,3-dioxygenase-like lactoylglutathione lyase family enzyme